VSALISFVVPVRNDAVRLETCLRSIRTAQAATDRVEIIVVDNGSTDRSPEIAGSFGAQVLVIERQPVSVLRNRGASTASGDVLAFVDADNEIVPGWIDAVITNLGDDTVGATGALYQAPDNGTWVQRGYDLLRGRTHPSEVAWLGSGNLAVRRQVFQDVGGFDTSLETCEDVDWCHRIRAAGWRILGDPRISSVHHGDPDTLRDLFKSELWRGRDNLRVSFRRPIVWASLPSAILPVVEAVFLGTGAIGLIAWFAGVTAGLMATFAALFLLVGSSLLKVLRASARSGQAHRQNVLRVLVVACVWEIARVFALFARASHRRARPKSAATTAS
jgi:GT2 family glycosyltransferase